MAPLVVALTGSAYAFAAFALSVAVGDGDTTRTPRSAAGAIDGYGIKVMSVTLGCAAIGAFAATRALTLEQSIVSFAVVVALAAAITCKPSSLPRTLAALGVAVAVVVSAAALDSMWLAVFSALLAALPFLVTAAFVPDRRPTFCSAGVAALAGASIGMTGALFVLCVASVCALALTKIGRRSTAKLALAPYIAAFTLFGILINLSILV